MNSLVYSVIKVNFTINQKYIIDNFCINKDSPELKCDGKCYLAEQIRAEKERQESTPAFRFGQDFGVFITTNSLYYQHPIQSPINITHQAFYRNLLLQSLRKEIEHPPQG